MINGTEAPKGRYPYQVALLTGQVVAKMINVLEGRFGQVTVKRESLHMSVCIDFEITNYKRVKILMDESPSALRPFRKWTAVLVLE